MSQWQALKKAFFIGYIGMGLGLSSPAQAHFIEDFYNSAATQGNVTVAGIHETAGLKVVTGGGYVYKAPRNDFTPFHFSPPKLSAGCGGIDLFMEAAMFIKPLEMTSLLFTFRLLNSPQAAVGLTSLWGPLAFPVKKSSSIT